MSSNPTNRHHIDYAGLAGRRVEILATVASITIAAVVLAIFVHSPGMDGSDKARFHEMVYGQAHKPFVTRALLPLAVRVAAELLPQTIHETCTRLATDQPMLDEVFQRLGWDPQYALEFAVALTLMAAALIVFRYALLSLLRATYAAPAEFALFSSSAALMALPVFFRYYSHIYDFPNLALFTLCLTAIVRYRWAVYLSFFVLATVNKETSILLVALFAVYFRLRPLEKRSLYLGMLIAQLAIYAIVRTSLVLAFIDNPGSVLEFHLLDHNIGRLQPLSVSSAAAWLFIVLLVGVKWRAKPLFARLGILVIVPLCGMGVLFGFIDELRMYYEAYPSLCLLLYHSVGTIWGLPVRAISRADGERL